MSPEVDKRQATILVVDDTPVNIDVVKGVLSPTYLVQAATSGVTALEIVVQSKPDLILLDIMMPGMDGYEVLKRLRGSINTVEIPVIFLTGKTQEADEEKGLLLGAQDYLNKPLQPAILKARIQTHLTNKAAKLLLASQNTILEQRVKKRTQQLSNLQDVSMVALGALAESRDPETGNHLRRTQGYVRALATSLKKAGHHLELLTYDNIELLVKSAPLHDIGKVGVPDHILLKPGKLTGPEFDVMKNHPQYAKTALEVAISNLDQSENFLEFALEIAYGHHEKWDGSGYPNQLSGTNIPLPARLMAIADVYDALISRRVYKPPFSHEEAVKLIREGHSTHFDPLLVEQFLAIETEFHKIALTYVDSEATA